MLLDLLFGPPGRLAATQSLSASWWPMSRTRTSAGVVVDEDLALTYAAVFRASRLLSESASNLPIQIFRREPSGDREQEMAHPLGAVLKFPNPTMGGTAFRTGRTLHQVNWGNGFAEIVLDRRNQVAELWPIHPARVRPVLPRDDAPGYAYMVRNNDGTQVAMKAEEVLHIPGCLAEDGVWGKGVITYAREMVGFGIGVERYGSTYFGTGGSPRGVVTGPGMQDPEARRQFRREWKEIHGSPDSGEIAILPVESKYTKVSMSNEDNQFLETRRQNKNEIATIYGLPARMLNDPTAATKATVEQDGLDYVIYSLFPWVRLQEEHLALKLLTAAERPTLFLEYNFAGLLRGDIQARMTAYRVGIMTGVLTINYCRRLENLNGIGPAGDVNYVPANMTTAEAMEAGPPVPGGPLGPGSDHSGAPADSGGSPGANGQSESAFAAWAARLPRSREQELESQIRAIEGRLEHVPVVTREAARAVLVQALRQMFAKEAHAAERAAKDSGKWDAWTEEFFAKHQALLRDALGPACGVVGCLGIRVNPEDLAGRLTAESRTILRAAYNSETPDVFARRLAAWPTERAQAVADEVLSGAYEPGGTPSAPAPAPSPAPVTVNLHVNPDVRIAVPPQLPPTVQVNVPQQPAPVVNVPISVPAQAPPVVEVNVPQQPAPVVNVAPPPPAPEYDVVPERDPTTGLATRFKRVPRRGPRSPREE